MVDWLQECSLALQGRFRYSPPQRPYSRAFRSRERSAATDSGCPGISCELSGPALWRRGSLAKSSVYAGAPALTMRARFAWRHDTPTPSEGAARRSVRVSPLTKTRTGSSKVCRSTGYSLIKRFGKDVNRPQLELMMSFVREGDTIICHSMDRLGRNLYRRPSYPGAASL